MTAIGLKYKKGQMDFENFGIRNKQEKTDTWLVCWLVYAAKECVTHKLQEFCDGQLLHLLCGLIEQFQ